MYVEIPQHIYESHRPKNTQDAHAWVCVNAVNALVCNLGFLLTEH